MSPVVKMQKSEATLGCVGVVVGWATVYYSEGLLCHGLGQVQPSSAKFTSETSHHRKIPRFGLAMTDTERRNPRKKTRRRRKTSKIGWVAGRRLPMTAWMLLEDWLQRKQVLHLVQPTVAVLSRSDASGSGPKFDKTTNVTSFFSSSSCMRCIIQNLHHSCLGVGQFYWQNVGTLPVPSVAQNSKSGTKQVPFPRKNTCNWTVSPTIRLELSQLFKQL